MSQGLKMDEFNILIVPYRSLPLPESFISFLWEREIPAFLVYERFLHHPEIKNTGLLGVRITPGTC